MGRGRFGVRHRSSAAGDADIPIRCSAASTESGTGLQRWQESRARGTRYGVLGPGHIRGKI